jgi:predicted TIM-barrel fold metal-dependent hydrolase
MVIAGAPPETIDRLGDSKDPDVAGRLGGAGVLETWERCKHTGFGEVGQWVARECYGMEEITVEGVKATAAANRALRRPGERLRILKEGANLDYVQIDAPGWGARPENEQADEAGRRTGFFRHDMSWSNPCAGRVDPKELFDETRIEVRDLKTLGEAFAAIFARYAPGCVAIKSAHVYWRPLAWTERPDADAERALQAKLAGRELTAEDQVCLGDWCWSRGAELAADYGLPFKIHTGILGGYDYCDLRQTRVADLAPLLAKHRRTRFLMLHIAFPYEHELMALCRHYVNCYADMACAWSVDSQGSAEFVRGMIHTAPINKLFVFGADMLWPNQTAACAAQARQGLTRALDAEVREGCLPEKQAMRLATRVMRENQQECFPV